MRIRPEVIAARRRTRSAGRYANAYQITDGTVSACVGGADALDALVWYAMPTPDEFGRFTYDTATDIATLYDMTATPKEAPHV